MLSLTRKTEYALIAMCHLAHAEKDEVVSARGISDRHGVPLPLLMNVLKKLNRSGYIESVRGAKGGYLLAVPPQKITLTNLVEAVEGPVQLVRCKTLDKRNPDCGVKGRCPIRGAVHKVHYRLRGLLSEVTIADLAFDTSANFKPARIAAE